ncbi:hypothetical protein HH310_22850 [Actinoplanes sp. TBRC 11911]|uniref:hypothetical protein n=1 Tax=Actinoplanes sp. TBRC 11911 TaxID=2729386 RepID=UPI00145F97B1|nr:hypothetical protein [Actinoplanes sp. TBRC 11911]NMO54008.1 hypothetical protein [Actinoplanes sp. TBRC 11911]
MRPVRRPTLAVALGWVAAALVATVAGLGGIRLVGDNLTGTPGGVLTEEDVRRALGTQPSVAADGSSAAPLDTPLARPSGPAGVRPSSPAPGAGTATGPAAPPDDNGGDNSGGDDGGGPAGPAPTAGGPTANRTAAPPTGRPAPAPTATSKMGDKPGATKAPPARGVEASFTTSGGTAIARCTGTEAYLVSWSPRPGYSVERAEQGPDHEVEVRFEGDEGRSELKISCSNGTPVAETKDDD